MGNETGAGNDATAAGEPIPVPASFPLGRTRSLWAHRRRHDLCAVGFVSLDVLAATSEVEVCEGHQAKGDADRDYDFHAPSSFALVRVKFRLCIFRGMSGCFGGGAIGGNVPDLGNGVAIEVAGVVGKLHGLFVRRGILALGQNGKKRTQRRKEQDDAAIDVPTLVPDRRYDFLDACVAAAAQNQPSGMQQPLEYTPAVSGLSKATTTPNSW